MNRRRILSSIHRDIARQRTVNTAASLRMETAADTPLTRLSDQQLDEAGAALLPRMVREVCPVCLGTREVQQQVTDNLTATASCAECGGRGYLEEQA